MAIIGWEMVAVVVIAGLFLWGPQKIPELAKALGTARREYEAAAKGQDEKSGRDKA